MRCFLSFGLLIPAIAAISGVVTWSVSAQMIRSSKDDTQMHLSPSRAAFRFSQGARDHEWHSLLNNEQVDTSQSDSKEDYDLTLDSMTPDPVSTSPSPNTSESLHSLNSASTSVPQVTATSVSLRISTVQMSNSSSTLPSASTIRPATASAVDTLATPAESTAASRLLTNSVSNNTVAPDITDVPKTTLATQSPVPVRASETKKSKNKKSPGEHVAAVIDKLISTRKYEGSKAKILVVAPASGTSRKSIDSMIANVYSTDVSIKKGKSPKQVSSKMIANKPLPMTPAAAPAKATESGESTTLPSRPVSATSSSPLEQTFGNIRRTNRTQAVLSKDADTLMAAAAILSARHEMIASRFDHQQIKNSVHNFSSLNDLFTTVKPPTTPFSRINHMQFPPPRAVSSLSAGKPLLQQQQQQQLQQQLQQKKQLQLQEQLQQQLQLHEQQEQKKQQYLQQHLQQQLQQHPHIQVLSSAKLHHRSLEKQQRQREDNHIALSSHPMVTHILPDRRVILHHHNQPGYQVHHLSSSVAPQLLQQAVIFTGHRASPLENVSPHHLQEQQVHQQQSRPLEQLSAPALHRLTGPLQQVNVAPMAQPVAPGAGHMMTRPTGQVASYENSMYQPATNAPFLVPSDHNNNEPVDESQIISQSAHTINGEESKNNAMISMHAADQQSGESSKGLTLHFGGGPGAAGSQLITSPMGIFKSLFLPLLPKPRMKLNGKVVFGVVLDSQITPKKG